MVFISHTVQPDSCCEGAPALGCNPGHGELCSCGWVSVWRRRREEQPAAPLVICAGSKIGFPGIALQLGGGDGQACLQPSKGWSEETYLPPDGQEEHAAGSLLWSLMLGRSRLVCNSLLTALNEEQLSCSVPCSSSKHGHSGQTGIARDTLVSRDTRVRIPDPFTTSANICLQNMPRLCRRASVCSLVARKLEVVESRGSTADIKAWSRN